MGGSVSTTYTELKNAVETSLTNTCTSTGVVSNIAKGIKVNIDGRGSISCNARNIINQNATAKSSCDIDAAVTQILDSLQKSTTEAIAKGFGLSIASNISKTKAEIKTYIKNTCSSTAKAENILLNPEVTVYCPLFCSECTNEIVQSGDVQAQCAIKLLLDQASKIDQKTQTTAVADFKLFGGIFAAIVGIIVVIILLVFLSSIGGKKSNQPQVVASSPNGGGGSGGGNGGSGSGGGNGGSGSGGRSNVSGSGRRGTVSEIITGGIDAVRENVSKEDLKALAKAAKSAFSKGK